MASAAGRRVSIIVDARFIRGTGIARYLREVTRRVLADPRFHSATLVGDPAQVADYLATCGDLPPELRVLSLDARYYSPRMQLQWAMHRLRGRLEADVAFFPHYDAPVVLGAKRAVVTIQDVTHFRVPELFPGWKRAVASAVFSRVVGTAERVLVTSESTARDLLEQVPAAAAKIHLIPLGVGEPFDGPVATAPREIEELRPFLLFVGNRKPHKNLAAAVEALAILRRDDAALRLVLAGHSYPGWARTLDRARELGVADALVELTEVSDDTLRALYSRCEALLLPSFYEGFGLPALEAMACGAPVVASNRASLPEVVGDAGLLVDPERPAELAEAVRRLRADPALARDLRERGRVRAARLTWANTAEQTTEFLYRTAVAPRRGPG